MIQIDASDIFGKEERKKQGRKEEKLMKSHCQLKAMHECGALIVFLLVLLVKHVGELAVLAPRAAVPNLSGLTDPAVLEGPGVLFPWKDSPLVSGVSIGAGRKDKHDSGEEVAEHNF